MNASRWPRCLWLLIAMAALTGCLGPVQRPVADFTWCPDGSAGALDFVFTSRSTTVPGHWIESMRWEFDDGTPAEVAAWDVWHRFREPGLYHVTLTVTDSRGVSAAVTRDVPVARAAEVLPNWQLMLGWPIRITGVVANRAGMKMPWVTIQAKFYDSEGVRITDGFVTILDLDPDEKVAFTIDAPEYSARIFHATVEVDSFLVECSFPRPIPVFEDTVE